MHSFRRREYSPRYQAGRVLPFRVVRDGLKFEGLMVISMTVSQATPAPVRSLFLDTVPNDHVFFTPKRGR